MRHRAHLGLGELHWPLVAVVVLIGLLGIYNLHSAAAAREPDLYLTQLAMFGAGWLMVVLLLVPDYRVTEGLAYPVYAVAVLLLLGVIVQGRTAMGAERWINLGPFSFQPSEPTKLAVILCLARYFGQRNEPGGYSMRSLFRPLNPSRPVVVILALIVKWNNHWLADPVGQLARSIRANLDGAVPLPGDLMWFRAFLIALLVAACAGGVVLVVRAQRRRELLNPWSRARRNAVIAVWVAACLVLGALLAHAWSAPLLRDPFGVLIAFLNRAAAPGGRYAHVIPGLGLRLPLALGAAIYLVTSLLRLRKHSGSLVDLAVAPIDLLAVPALLVLVEPDLGTAGIIVLIGATIILMVGVRLRTLVIMSVMGACVAAVGWFGILKDYQKSRILTFIDPENDIKGAGWNAVQSMIAVGSGRWTGKGHLNGTQTQLSFLPEQHTDFVFPVWAEEQGFLGGVVILTLYALLLVFALSIAAEAREKYGALLAVGVAALIFWQAVINIGMVIGAFPVVGVTLPLFSYGGSSLITVLIGVALLLNVHWRRRAH